MKTGFLKKGMISVMFASMLACSMTAFGEGKPQMTIEEYPRIDGSLACVPLCEALAMEITGCSEFEAEDTMADFTNTNPCYHELSEGRCDIILAYEAAEATKAEIPDFDSLNLQPVGKDALVFITNVNNPVESLTVQELYDIYTGKITNWSEVGGNDCEIMVFSRPEKSGSQTLMRKLLIGDAQVVENSEEITDMEGIINVLRDYDNSANAIGFSVYYYASTMHSQPDLKFISVEGVEPLTDTIRTDEYPLTNAFYCGTTGASSENAIAIQDWMLSEEGQMFVEECGYVPAR